MAKIISISQAKNLIIKNKELQMQVGLCHGTFDFIHLGHIRHFKEAKDLCDILFVSITPDRFFAKERVHPLYNENERAEFLSCIDCIDYVLINNDADAISLLKEIKPHFYFKGPDYKNYEDDPTGKIILEAEAIKSANGDIVFTSSKEFSSSKIINRYLGAR